MCFFKVSQFKFCNKMCQFDFFCNLHRSQIIFCLAQKTRFLNLILIPLLHWCSELSVSALLPQLILLSTVLANVFNSIDDDCLAIKLLSVILIESPYTTDRSIGFDFGKRSLHSSRLYELIQENNAKKYLGDRVCNFD